MTMKTAAAPGGGAALGNPTVGAPAWSVGVVGYVVNRSRSRPGSSLGGITCATAANETLTIAQTARSRHTPANIPQLHTSPSLQTYLAQALTPTGLRRQVLNCFNKVTQFVGTRRLRPFCAQQMNGAKDFASVRPKPHRIRSPIRQPQCS
jgi:hypothetical protein